MPIGRLLEELKILQLHLEREQPDLDFILTHTRSLMQIAENAANGAIAISMSDVEVNMIRRYQDRHCNKYDLPMNFN